MSRCVSQLFDARGEILGTLPPAEPAALAVSGIDAFPAFGTNNA